MLPTEGFRTGQTQQDRTNSGKDSYRTRRMQNRTIAIQKVFRAGPMQDRTMQDECRTGQLQDRRDAEQDGYRTKKLLDRTMQERMNAGHDICKSD